MVRLPGWLPGRSWPTMGGDHDITMRLEIPGSRYIGLYAELLGGQDWRVSRELRATSFVLRASSKPNARSSQLVARSLLVSNTELARYRVLINGNSASTLTVMIRKFIAGVSLMFVSFAFAAAASKPNLVLITIGSTRADRMGFLGAKGALTPNLDRLAAESIVFEHAYAQAPGSVVSHATILSGAYPQSTGISDIGGMLSSSLPYLPELLKTQGYRTAAFVGSIDLDPWSGLAQGFDRGFRTYDAGVRPASAGTGAPVHAQRSPAANEGHRSSPTQRRPDQVVTSAAA